MACCDRPDPRILSKNGRLYCRSCRRYLDVPAGTTTRPAKVPDSDTCVDDARRDSRIQKNNK